MKRLALGLLLLLAQPQPSLHAKDKNGCAEMNASHLVSILADYDVKQVALPAIAERWHIFGATTASRHEIVINAAYTDPIRRLSVIHELFHVRHHQEDRGQEEKLIRQCAIREYKRMFGGDLDLPEPMREPSPLQQIEQLFSPFFPVRQ